MCPNCEREFASANQAHVCVPGITVDDLLTRHPRWVSEIYGAIIRHLKTLGPVHEDAVNVGIFLKSDRKIASFRPRVRSVLLSFFLPYELTDPRIARALPVAAGRIAHMINLTSADQVDDQLREWLTEAYDFNTSSKRLVAVVRLLPADLVIAEGEDQNAERMEPLTSA